MTDFIKITNRILDLAERALEGITEAQETMVAGKVPEEPVASSVLNTLRRRVSELSRHNEDLQRDLELLGVDRDKYREVAEKRGEELAAFDRIRSQSRLDPSGKKYFLVAVGYESLGGPLMVTLGSFDFNPHVDTYLHIELQAWLEWEVT